MNKQVSDYLFDSYIITDYERVSTNCISWFGEDLAAIDGIVDNNEEQFLAVDHPLKHGLLNCICGKSLVCHFAYQPQRHYLETKTDLLRDYELLAEQRTASRLII